MLPLDTSEPPNESRPSIVQTHGVGAVREIGECTKRLGGGADGALAEGV